MSTCNNLQGLWPFLYRARIGERGHERKTGYRPCWIQKELIAVTPCDAGLFRNRLALYIKGSESGLFFPYPGLYGSEARYLSC